MKTFFKQLLIVVWYFLYCFITAIFVGWSCDNLFDTDLLDRLQVLYITILITIPLVKNQYFKN
jgi:hypothetical protein